MNWMDEIPYPGPDEPEDIASFVNRQQLQVNGGFSADGVTTHFEMRPDGTLVNKRPFTISSVDLQRMEPNLRLQIENSVGVRWYNPANSSWNINPA